MNWIASIGSYLISALVSSPQIQSLERSAMKVVGTWLIGAGMTTAQATTTTNAMSDLVTGGIILALGLLGSARSNTSGNASATAPAAN